MSHHVERKRATSLALSETDLKIERFEDSFDVSEAEKAAVGGEKAAKGQGQGCQSLRRTPEGLTAEE